MVLMHYFKTKGGLHDLKGTLSQSMPSPAIDEANKEVRKVTNEQLSKCRPYKHYSPRLRTEIGQYASHHGIAAAARYFLKKLKQCVSENHGLFAQKHVRWRSESKEASRAGRRWRGHFISAPQEAREISFAWPEIGCAGTTITCQQPLPNSPDKHGSHMVATW